MPTTVDTFPDAEAAAGTLIRASGLRCYSSIPKRPEYPLVTARRLGGLPVTRMRLDAADIQIDSWAASKSAARLQAVQARAAIWLGEGTTVSISSGNAFVTGVTDVTGLFWLPDPTNTPVDHYTFTVRLYLHAA